MLHLGVICLLPEMFKALDYGITGRAIQQKRVQIDYWNPRDWTQRPYRKVDDKPYGGGPGMVMMYEPLSKAIVHARQNMPEQTRTIYLSPQGRTLVQEDLNQLATKQQPLLFVAGRYEGIDERIIDQHIDEEWSVGDFVLSGGELAAMILIDGIVRLLPGALGHLGSAQEDSYMNGLLDHPHYTRPEVVNGLAVPEVLLKGDHQAIARWRRQQSLGKTWLKRPDLLEQRVLTQSDQQLLEAYQALLAIERSNKHQGLKQTPNEEQP